MRFPDSKISSMMRSFVGLVFFLVVPMVLAHSFRGQICELLGLNLRYMQVIYGLVAIGGYCFAVFSLKVGGICQRTIVIWMAIAIGAILVVAVFLAPILANVGSLQLAELTLRKLTRILSLAFFAAAVEEVLFRGYLLDILRLYLPRTLCCLCIAALFMLAHTQVPLGISRSSLHYFLAGIFFTQLCMLPRMNVLTPMIVHFMFDCAAFAMYGHATLKFSGISNNSPQDAAWAMTIVFLIAAVLLEMLTRKSTIAVLASRATFTVSRWIKRRV